MQEQIISTTIEPTSEKLNFFTKNNETLSIGIICLVFLSSTEFFRIFFLSRQIIYLLQFGVIGVLLAINLFNIVYWKRESLPRKFRFGFILISIGVGLSVYFAYVYNYQNVIITLWAQRTVYFYLFYSTLHILRIRPDLLIKLVFFFGVLYSVLYILQYVTFPTKIFDVRQELDRGTVRIFLKGASYKGFAFLFCLQEILFRNSRKHIYYALFFLSVTFLTGSRSILLNDALIIVLAVIFSKKVKSKYLLIFLLALVMIPIYFIFQDIFTQLFEISLKQGQNAENNVRARAIHYFLNNFSPNKLSYLTGNGEFHFSSPYGQKVASLMFYNGYYMSDVGIVGAFIKYGAIFILGGLFIIFKSLFTRVNTHYMFLRYYLINTIISIVLASTFTTAYSIIAICLICYILDAKDYYQSLISSS